MSNPKDHNEIACAIRDGFSRLSSAIETIAGNENAKLILERIAQLEGKIMITQQELATGLKAVASQQGKIATEQAAKSDALLAKIKELEDAIANGPGVSDEVEKAFNEVKTASQALDDVIPDAPPNP